MAAASRKTERNLTARFELRLPPVLPHAIEAAAARNLMTASEYIRRSVIDRLRADGFDLSEKAA